MDDEMIELAREAVACVPIEEWPAGTLAFPQSQSQMKLRITGPKEWTLLQGDEWKLADDGGTDPGEMDALLPDLTDPATLGCLLHLVREVWGDPTIYMAAHSSFWIPARPLGVLMNCDAPTEAHALVAALKAGGER